MMNFENGGYSSSFLLNELKSANRTVWYEYTVQNQNGHTIGFIDVQSASITFDSSKEVMRSLSGTAPESEFVNLNTIDNRIIPWFCLKLKNGNVVKWPLGRFIINPAENCQNNVRMISFTGYDLGKIAYDDKLLKRYCALDGSIYTSEVGQLLGVDYDNVDIVPSLKTRSYPQEWEIGERRISVANTLLAAINYNPAHFDEFGKCIIDPVVYPVKRPVDMQYRTKEMSITLDGVTKTSDKFDIPNKFVRYTENVDSEYLISTYSNENPASPYSIQNRGRVIVDSRSVNDIATQDDLDAFTIKEAIEKTASTDKIEFSTLNMPCHGFKNCLYVEIEMYGISDKYIETAWQMDLKNGGTMKHICERVVDL